MSFDLKEITLIICILFNYLEYKFQFVNNKKTEWKITVCGFGYNLQDSWDMTQIGESFSSVSIVLERLPRVELRLSQTFAGHVPRICIKMSTFQLNSRNDSRTNLVPIFARSLLLIPLPLSMTWTLWRARSTRTAMQVAPESTAFCKLRFGHHRKSTYFKLLWLCKTYCKHFGESKWSELKGVLTVKYDHTWTSSSAQWETEGTEAPDRSWLTTLAERVSILGTYNDSSQSWFQKQKRIEKGKKGATHGHVHCSILVRISL